MACNQGPCPTKLPDCTGSRAWSALCTCFEMKLLTFKSCWIAVPCFSQCHWRQESESVHWRLNRSSWLPRSAILDSLYFAFHMTHLVAVHFMFFRVFRSCNCAHLPIFHAVFIVYSEDAESTLTSIQDDDRLLFTNDVNYLDLPFLFLLLPPFVLHASKSCRSRRSF